MQLITTNTIDYPHELLKMETPFILQAMEEVQQMRNI